MLLQQQGPWKIDERDTECVALDGPGDGGHNVSKNPGDRCARLVNCQRMTSRNPRACARLD